MKTIGLLGGMSWESTALYYRLINEETKKRLGGLHSAPLILYSVDFQEIETMQNDGDWAAAADRLAAAARRVERAGADFLLICTEIGMLVDAQHTDAPLFDTTSIHAQQAVSAALGQ